MVWKRRGSSSIRILPLSYSVTRATIMWREGNVFIPSSRRVYHGVAHSPDSQRNGESLSLSVTFPVARGLASYAVLGHFEVENQS